MKRKWKDLIIVIVINILVLGFFIGPKIYIKNNYDLKVVTNHSTGFFIFSTSHDTYYLVNSSLGIKTKTKELGFKSDKLSDEQLQQLEELEKIDEKYILIPYRDTQNYVFFYENYIFYTRYYGESGPHISDEDHKDMRDNIYKYDIDTQEIEQIKRYKGELGYSSTPDVKFETLNYLYPGFTKAISSKCDTDNRLNIIFYDNGRIFFSTYFDSATIWESNHLYEYVPATDKVKKIASTRDVVVNVNVVK